MASWYTQFIFRIKSPVHPPAEILVVERLVEESRWQIQLGGHHGAVLAVDPVVVVLVNPPGYKIRQSKKSQISYLYLTMTKSVGGCGERIPVHMSHIRQVSSYKSNLIISPKQIGTYNTKIGGRHRCLPDRRVSRCPVLTADCVR